MRCVVQNVESSLLDDLLSRLLHLTNIGAGVDGRATKWTDLRLRLAPGNVTAVHIVARFLLRADGRGPEVLLRVPDGICSLP